ncbi:MAG: hypothetical protein A3H35_14270, partial [Betaproteobacteria bacterium RIFCSPLOWO2_02_FULL_62_17]
EKTHGKNIPVEKTQAFCRAYAAEQIESQMRDFKRLGVLGDWAHPYRTMDYISEANEIRALLGLLQKGYIYRGLKPVNWCFDCGSALAEAEVEYADRRDPAIDVGFAFAEPEKLTAAFGMERLPSDQGWAVIWTTTPWTIPANQALNVHPDFVYELVSTPRGLLILAAELRDACLARFGLTGEVLASCKGVALDRIAFRHPFYDRLSPVFLGDYVTLEQGTGVVHSAPAYGIEDFQSCRRYGMKDDQMLTPVMGDGRFSASLPFFGGLNIWKANAEIVAKMDAGGSLFSSTSYEHSTMHCWRHKTPIIYRATTQWFAGMEDVPGFNGVKPRESLRETALRGIENTQFYPAWGKARLRGMIANRPDWTLSRQRQWGVPMPFFVHRESGALHPDTPALTERVALRVEREGIEAWQRITAEEWLGDEARNYEKARDTLDVWFDSGVTHATVMGGPRFSASLPFFGGLNIWKANAEIVAKMDAGGSLFSSTSYEHSTMHCWRHKTPIIYRATTQWFAGMEDVPGFNGVKPRESLRETALRGIEATQFYPAWGKARLRGMIANRPDWTLSRQRQWGVPMPFFVHRESGALHPDTPALTERVALRVEREGIEAWQRITAEEWLGDEARNYEKARDTLDVWFDSGVTHATVMGGPDGEKKGIGSHGADLKFPADLYLEGSDQHRGWFHSSLLVSSMMWGVPPYKALLTHGFVVDGHGRKMSKSMGNVVAPQKVADTLGAEILRLWTAATDYSGELSISDEILKRVVESYRRIRNTLRFLLANTSDFDPAAQMLPVSDWLEIDRYALALTQELQQAVTSDYERYEFHLIVARIQTFCSEDLGSFFLDILKDRLYTTRANSRERRSAQCALHHIVQALLRLIAPVLSFTAEEAWRSAGGASESIFLESWHQLPAVDDAPALLVKWAAIRELRGEVQKQLEALREAGSIGSSLQAEVTVKASGERHALLAGLGDDLRFVLITSKAELRASKSAADEAIEAVPSSHAKCQRCWHWREDVGAEPAHAGLCGRCLSNLFGAGEPRRFA